MKRRERWWWKKIDSKFITDAPLAYKSVRPKKWIECGRNVSNRNLRAPALEREFDILNSKQIRCKRIVDLFYFDQIYHSILFDSRVIVRAQAHNLSTALFGVFTLLSSTPA